jgi:hypothetical protein
MDVKARVAAPDVKYGVAMTALGDVMAEFDQKYGWEQLWNEIFQLYPPSPQYVDRTDNIRPYDIIVTAAANLVSAETKVPKESVATTYWNVVLDCANFLFSTYRPVNWWQSAVGWVTGTQQALTEKVIAEHEAKYGRGVGQSSLWAQIFMQPPITSREELTDRMQKALSFLNYESPQEDKYYEAVDTYEEKMRVLQEQVLTEAGLEEDYKLVNVAYIPKKISEKSGGVRIKGDRYRRRLRAVKRNVAIWWLNTADGMRQRVEPEFIEDGIVDMFIIGVKRPTRSGRPVMIDPALIPRKPREYIVRGGLLLMEDFANCVTKRLINLISSSIKIENLEQKLATEIRRLLRETQAWKRLHPPRTGGLYPPRHYQCLVPRTVAPPRFFYAPRFYPQKHLIYQQQQQQHQQQH